jgi:hypothetical protein
MVEDVEDAEEENRFDQSFRLLTRSLTHSLILPSYSSERFASGWCSVCMLLLVWQSRLLNVDQL